MAHVDITLEPHVIAEHVRAQRWFGDKTGTIERVEIVDAIPVRWHATEREFVVMRVAIRTANRTGTYQLFADIRDGNLRDALDDAAFRRGLVDAFQIGAAFESRGTRWVVASETREPLVVPPAAPIHRAKGEQTNSSIVIDREGILKLYRRLEPGIHPDVEVTRFLTIERQFAHVPALLGTIRFESADGETIAGMLQELVPGAADAWTYALDAAKRFTRGGSLPFVTEAGELGRVTRALHETLASGAPGSAFERRRATAADVQRWSQRALDMVKSSATAFERAASANSLPRVTVSDVEATRDAVKRAIDRASQTRSLLDDPGAMARTHGDYHLGQVLRSATGQFLVIDFEGEPSRPLDDRRTHQSPLRDVAGMLRSFAYAAAVAEVGDEWEEALRGAFLDGYFAELPESGSNTLLPRSRANAMQVIQLFETEKLFYELRYELDHRPDWVWVPLRGIARL